MEETFKDAAVVLSQCPACIKTLSRVLDIADALIGPIHEQNVFGHLLYSVCSGFDGGPRGQPRQE